MIDRTKFFAGIRQQPFPGKLKQAQVDGCEVILAEWERRKIDDLRFLAYMLATTKWETDDTMQPIQEAGGKAYLTRMYDVNGQRPALARRNGNVNPGDGARYSGKGYVQLTWRNNYRKMGSLLGLPLENAPEMAMQPGIACQIMFEGMLHGLFTGNKLSDYFDGRITDWVNARRIINGTDKAVVIAGIANQFYADLVQASA